MRRPPFRAWILLSALLAAAPASQASTFLLSQSASCFSGGCEFVPNMVGPGASTDILRTFTSPPELPGALSLQNSAAMTLVNYDRFRASVGSTVSLQDYPSGTPGTVGPNLSALAKATIADVVTVGGASGVGTLRMRWHITGGVDVGWSITGPVSNIDHSQVSLALGCSAQTIPTPTLPGCGAARQLTWNAPGAVDELLDIDIPIRFGTPVQYQLAASLQSSGGTGYITGDGLISFQGHALGSFGSTGTLVSTQVLDSFGNPIAGGTILAESGFRYDLVGVPEPGVLPLVSVGMLVLAARGRTRA